MTTPHRTLLTLITLPLLLAGSAAAQDAPAEPPETVDDVTEDIDLLQQMNMYQFTVEQLQAMLPILQELDAKRQALSDYKRSGDSLAPMRALRAALLKGDPAGDLETAVEPVWDQLMTLEEEYEDAVAPTMKKVAALLTDDQLTVLIEGDEWAYDEADKIFATLETARSFNDETFGAWRDRVARQVAFGAAGESEARAAEVQAETAKLLDKAKALGDDDFMDQYDDLFDELQQTIATAQPKPIREVAEAQAAEELEFILRSERAYRLVGAQVAARAQ